MWPVLVVLGQPVVGDGLYLFDGIEQVGIEHFRSERPVEALDVGVLVGLAGLDVVQGDAPAPSLLDEVVARHLRAVVHTNRQRRARNELLRVMHGAQSSEMGLPLKRSSKRQPGRLIEIGGSERSPQIGLRKDRQEVAGDADSGVVDAARQAVAVGHVSHTCVTGLCPGRASPPKSRPRSTTDGNSWSGRRESNPRMKLGKLPFYH